MKIGIIRTNRRVSEALQREKLAEWGADPKHIWKLGKGEENLDFFLDAHIGRTGDVIGIYRLSLLIDPGRGTHDKIKTDVRKLLETGASLYEIETGKTWDERADLVDMVADAIKQLSSGRVGMNGPGRPAKHVYTDEQRQIISAIWNSKEHTNDAQREDAVHKIAGLEKFNKTVMHRWKAAERDQH